MTLKQEKDVLSSAVETLTKMVVTLQNKVDGLKNTVARLEGENGLLRDRVNAIERKNNQESQDAEIRDTLEAREQKG